MGWKQAAAEHLPFKDGWFDAAHAHLVMHVVDDVGAALSEMARVLCPGGRLVVVSFRSGALRPVPPEPVLPDPGRDRPRPVPGSRQRCQRPSAGPDSRTWPSGGLHQRVMLAPEAVLERVRGRYISTLHLLDEREYQDGLARLEHDMAGR